MNSLAKYYSHNIFPFLMERNLSSRETCEQRRLTLTSASGLVLEIGYGTGLNLPYYHSDVTAIKAIETNSAMEDFIARRTTRPDLHLELYNMSAQEMSFDDNTFDCVVSTFTFCSIPRVDLALLEIRRVLKPGGRLLFLEHGISPNKLIAALQNLTNPLFNHFAEGCNVNRDIKSFIESSGLVVQDLQQFYMHRPISGFTYRGRAIKI